MYNVQDLMPDSDDEEISWKVPETKIIDYLGLASLGRPVKVGDQVYALFRANAGEDETTEFYPAEVVRVLKNGVAVRFEDGDSCRADYSEFFFVEDIQR
eukprot:jgi/Hompol1/2111/HPOL_005852-RA